MQIFFIKYKLLRTFVSKVSQNLQIIVYVVLKLMFLSSRCSGNKPAEGHSSIQLKLFWGMN